MLFCVAGVGFGGGSGLKGGGDDSVMGALPVNKLKYFDTAIGVLSLSGGGGVFGKGGGGGDVSFSSIKSYCVSISCSGKLLWSLLGMFCTSDVCRWYLTEEGSVCWFDGGSWFFQSKKASEKFSDVRSGLT